MHQGTKKPLLGTATSAEALGALFECSLVEVSLMEQVGGQSGHPAPEPNAPLQSITSPDPACCWGFFTPKREQALF